MPPRAKARVTWLRLGAKDVDGVGMVDDVDMMDDVDMAASIVQAHSRPSPSPLS